MVAINGVPFRITMPGSADLVLNAIPPHKIESECHAPYWAELWPSAKVLAGFLDKLTIPQKFRIVEIGCGLGLCSMVLARHQRNPVACDISIDATRFARINIGSISQQNNVVCCDWRALPFKYQCNLVVGADLLYEEHQIQTVIGVLRDLLTEGGTACIADPQRPFWTAFKKAVQRSEYFSSSEVVCCREVEHSCVEVLTIVKA